MDNASKALVMAGAILIAVMLISLGVLLFTQARERTVGLIGATDTDIVNSHNQTFQNFVGVNKSQAEYRALVSQINAYNLNIEQSNQFGVISIASNSTGVTGSTTAGYILNEATAKNSLYYTIQVTKYYGNTAPNGRPGCISEMKVTGAANRVAQ